MRQVSTSIAIAAPPERVWAVLTDGAAYPEWNPFMPSLAGPIRVGATLRVRIRPPGGRAMTFKPLVLIADANRELRWKGRLILPGLFDGEHAFCLDPVEGGTLLRHSETFTGILVGLMGSGLFAQTERGFLAMNKALKARAEA